MYVVCLCCVMYVCVCASCVSVCDCPSNTNKHTETHKGTHRRTQRHTKAHTDAHRNTHDVQRHTKAHTDAHRNTYMTQTIDTQVHTKCTSIKMGNLIVHQINDLNRREFSKSAPFYDMESIINCRPLCSHSIMTKIFSVVPLDASHIFLTTVINSV